jgi:hypothetical protein
MHYRTTEQLDFMLAMVTNVVVEYLCCAYEHIVLSTKCTIYDLGFLVC